MFTVRSMPITRGSIQARGQSSKAPRSPGHSNFLKGLLPPAVEVIHEQENLPPQPSIVDNLQGPAPLREQLGETPESPQETLRRMTERVIRLEKEKETLVEMVIRSNHQTSSPFGQANHVREEREGDPPPRRSRSRDHAESSHPNIV